MYFIVFQTLLITNKKENVYKYKESRMVKLEMRENSKIYQYKDLVGNTTNPDQTTPKINRHHIEFPLTSTMTSQFVINTINCVEFIKDSAH